MLNILLYVIALAIISAVYYGYYHFTTNLDRELKYQQNQANLKSKL